MGSPESYFVHVYCSKQVDSLRYYGHFTNILHGVVKTKKNNLLFLIISMTGLSHMFNLFGTVQSSFGNVLRLPLFLDVQGNNPELTGDSLTLNSILKHSVSTA